jgi:hypothetical protein
MKSTQLSLLNPPVYADTSSDGPAVLARHMPWRVACRFTELEMEVAIGVLLVVALIALGVSVTVLIGSRVPEDVFERAQAHGRFSGLTAASTSGGGRGKRARAARLVPVPMSRQVPALRAALSRTR